jgi:hypothetical protein
MSPKVKALVLDKQKDVFFSRSGYEVNFDDDLWVLDKDVSITFNKLKEKVSDDLILTIKKYYVIMQFQTHHLIVIIFIIGFIIMFF